MRSYFAAFALLFPLALLCAQDVRPKDVREIAKNGSSAIPQLAGLLKNPAKDVRLEVVRQLTEIGGQGTLDPRSEEHTSELHPLRHLVCRLLLDKNVSCSAATCTASGSCRIDTGGPDFTLA